MSFEIADAVLALAVVLIGGRGLDLRTGRTHPRVVRVHVRDADDDAAVTAFGIDYATKQCEELLREGVEGLHFYTLNKAHSTTEVVKNLGFAN